MTANTTIADLIARSIDPILLKILVFGPGLDPVSNDEWTRNLQNKRKEIKEALLNQGHTVRYAEELVDPSVTGPMANPFFQELLLMDEYDFIVILVGPPGANTETGAIAVKPNLTRKSSFYLDENHSGGLAAAACRFAVTIGAHFRMYEYPRDLVECHLLTHIAERAAEIRTMKYLL